MTLLATDIDFVYSGGTNNSDPAKSIGGYPSINPINGISNNLFTNVKREDSLDGVIDYRCFYVFNNSETDSLYNVSIFFEDQISGISNCELGVAKSTDVQILSLNSTPTSGSFTIRYDNYVTGEIYWNSDYTTFQKNIEDALNGLDVLSGVVVNRLSDNVYSISFLGEADRRNHSLLETQSINLVPNTTVSFEKNIEGQPINSIAAQLPTSATPPYGVNFYETSNYSKILVGDLNPGDGFPIWIKRTSLGSVSNDETNGFTFRLNGNLNKIPTEQVSTSSKPCNYYE